MIRVLVVDDSPIAQRVITSLLKEEKQIEIVGVASDGREAVEKCRELKPDLVTMDVFMPEMDGIEATKRIMEESPTRIVIVSSMVNSKEDLRKSFTAVHFGAIEVVAKPHGALSGDYSQVQETLGRVIAEMMQARPEKRFSWMPSPWAGSDSAQAAAGQPASSERPAKAPHETHRPGRRLEIARSAGDKMPFGYVPRLICVGGSTGAPAVLHDILSSLPPDFPVPIVVAQHIARGFVRGMVEWLDGEIGLHVRLAAQGDRLIPGEVLLAPDDRHLGFSVRRKGYIDLLPGSKGEICVPSIDTLFGSAAQVYGRDCLGIILSGMGRDGAEGLLRIREAGGFTIGQNEESAVVYGMPKEASLRGAVALEADPPGIIAQLLTIAVNFG